MKLSKLKIWVLASRPKTLLASISPVLIGISLCISSKFSWAHALMILLGALLIQIATNFINDYYDFKKGTDTEQRLGPKRMMQAGLLTDKEMKIGISMVLILFFLLGIYFSVIGGKWILGLTVVSIFLSYSYTSGPMPLAYVGLGDIFSFLFFGPILTGTTVFLLTQKISFLSFLIGIPPGLFSVAILSVNNLRDIEDDKKTNKKTLAVRFGETFTKIEYLICILSACFLIPLMGVVYKKTIFFLPALTFLFLIPSIKVLFTQKGKSLNQVLQNTAKSLFIYSCLFIVAFMVEKKI